MEEEEEEEEEESQDSSITPILLHKDFITPKIRFNGCKNIQQSILKLLSTIFFKLAPPSSILLTCKGQDS
jgi:hypothetical protein